MKTLTYFLLLLFFFNSLLFAQEFKPHDERIGADYFGYVNIEFSPDMRFMVWTEQMPMGELMARKTGKEKDNTQLPARIWMCAMNPETGEMMPEDGRGIMMTYSKLQGTAQWGEDSLGVFAVAHDREGRIILARPNKDNQLELEALPLPPNPYRINTYPSRIKDQGYGFLVSLIVEPDRRIRLTFIDLENPSYEEIIREGSDPDTRSNPGIFKTFPRWFPELPLLTYGFRDRITGKVQVKQFNAYEPVEFPKRITYDLNDHSDDFPFIYDGELYLIGGAGGTNEAVIYKKQEKLDVYNEVDRIQVHGSRLLQPGSLNSFEPFEWESEVYSAFQVSETFNNPNPQPGKVKGEIWIANLFGDKAPYRISDDWNMMRVDPEFYIGNERVWVFYYSIIPNGSVIELHRCETGLVRK